MDIWDIERTKKNELHPTMKPIPLCEKGISDGSKKEDKVLDLFLGSGSTMVASHQLKRKCYGMELDCKYCEVIVQRMVKLDKTLTIKRNGVDETQKWLDKLT
jgi:DNA modification methylase